MLQIRLRKPSLDGGAIAKPVPVDSVTVACPDHLVLADLPVAKGLGSVTTASVVKNVGRRSRRQLGERVHFCVRCDFPIALYGRLSPCDHAFCLDCARSDSICYLCDERIQKIQTIKMMEGIIICAAPHCLKSFLKKADFEAHIQEKHGNLLQSNAEKDGGHESEGVSAKQTPSESTARAPTRPVFSPNSSSQGHDRPRDQQQQLPRPATQQQPPSQQQPYFVQMQHNLADPPQSDKNAPPGFERAGPQNSFSQQNFDNQVRMQQESGQQGILSETAFHDFPPPMQPNFAGPNHVMGPPQFGYPPFMPEGAHGFYEMARPDSANEQGSLLGFPPGPIGNFPDGFPRPWNMMPFDPNGPQGGVMDGFANMSDHPQGRGMFFQGGDYGRNNVVVLPSNMPPPSPGNRAMETGQGGSGVDPRDGKGILAPLPLPFHPPHHHLSQYKRDNNSYSGDMGRDGRGYGWQPEKHDSFGSGHDERS